MTGAVLDESASHVVSRSRFGAIPTTSTGSARAPRLRIFVLGATEVGTAAEPIGGAWLDQRPGQLLKYLVVQRDRVAQTEEIAEALWPGSSAKAPTNAVRHLVHVLREKLEPGRTRAGSAFVLQEGGGYRLNRRTVRVDVDEFEANVRVGLLAFTDGNSGTAEDRLTYRETAENRLALALELYRGDLLADLPYAEWALVERERLRDLRARSLQALASSRFDERDFDRAEEYMERLAEMEPFDNDVQRQHIALCMKRGRYSRASRLYALFRQRMLREFGEAPDFELADIRRETPPAGVNPTSTSTQWRPGNGAARRPGCSTIRTPGGLSAGPSRRSSTPDACRREGGARLRRTGRPAPKERRSSTRREPWRGTRARSPWSAPARDWRSPSQRSRRPRT